jgi:hypothetical protein
MGVLEIIDVTPVRGDLLGCCTPVKKSTHDRLFSDAVWPHGKEVVPRPLDSNAELDRIHCPWLADYLC